MQNSLHLYLALNDPTRTHLVGDTGPMYSIERPSRPEGTSEDSITIRRFGPLSSTRVQTIVGNIAASPGSLTLSLLTTGMQWGLEATHDWSWAFTGPDEIQYKWFILRQPVLMLNDNSQTPIARYRRAKIGIVSRSRRAFLEVFPAGVNLLDLVVVTFVTYMKQYYPPLESEAGGAGDSQILEG